MSYPYTTTTGGTTQTITFDPNAQTTYTFVPQQVFTPPIIDDEEISKFLEVQGWERRYQNAQLYWAHETKSKGQYFTTEYAVSKEFVRFMTLGSP